MIFYLVIYNNLIFSLIFFLLVYEKELQLIINKLLKELR